MFKKLFRYWKMRKLAAQLRKPHGKTGRKVGVMMNKANEYLYNFTIDAMQLKATDHLLEIGFGNGKFFNLISGSAPGIYITGIEFSGTMLKDATETNRGLLQKGHLKLVRGQSHQMDFPDNYFDKVFCINVAYFWDKPSAHLREIERVLKPGGKFFSIVRTPDSMKNMPFTNYGFRSYTKYEWEQWVGECGLKLNPTLLINEPISYFNGKPLQLQSYCFIAEKTDN